MNIIGRGVSVSLRCPPRALSRGGEEREGRQGMRGELVCGGWGWKHGRAMEVE